ncbi:permease [Thermodesulfobacteriota bacterium]
MAPQDTVAEATERPISGEKQTGSSSLSVDLETLKESFRLSYWKDEWKSLLAVIGVLGVCFFLPVGNIRFDKAIMEGLYLVKWYAQEHVLLCLIPAFFIAGAIAVFVSQEGVMKYLGPTAPKYICYPVASVSGTILAVCSCTVLPLFAGIWSRGAGLGPATAFLYSGPAINVLAIVLTARILGPELGVARAVGAVTFSVLIGLLMHLIFLKEEQEKAAAAVGAVNPDADDERPLWKTATYFFLMVAILVFANWGKPDATSGLWFSVYSAKWQITSLLSVFFAISLVRWFGIPWWKTFIVSVPVVALAWIFPETPLISFSAAVVALSILTTSGADDVQEWFDESWGFAKQILPLLFIGVLVAGFLLGRPDQEGIIPSEWVAWALGGNSLRANALASVSGAFMYFATLTEVPIVEGLLGSGMGKGPALALLLAGPALSLPNMLVINSVIGPKKTAVFVTLVCVMATISGIIYGAIF